MDTDSLVYDIKTEDFYEDIANDVEARFDTSGYSKTLGVKIMTEFMALRL